eukprot:scaffold10614_cov82-Skeletonema_dohrnii-CCMP3373.AAC.3
MDRTTKNIQTPIAGSLYYGNSATHEVVVDKAVKLWDKLSNVDKRGFSVMPKTNRGSRSFNRWKNDAESETVFKSEPGVHAIIFRE